MPFDGTPPTTEDKIRDLIDLLRDRSRWPEGFWWQFAHCQTCAMGLLVAANGLPRTIDRPESVVTEEWLGVDWGFVRRHFTSQLAGQLAKSVYAITPEDVAQSLEDELQVVSF